MRIRIVTPAPGGSRKGNRITTLRWAGILRSLGHRVGIEQEYKGAECDLLVVLHARRSHASCARFRSEHPDLPLFVTLTGTDVYQDLKTGPETLISLEWATRILLLQPLAAAELPEELRSRTRVVFQSARAPAAGPAANGVFEVCVLGHLRSVKDPFRTAEAARLLPEASRIRVLQVGSALSEDMARRARAEEAANPRYRWVGEQPRSRALVMLAHSRLLSLTSLLEGGANAISEALAAGVPVVSSRIAGSVGLLGEDYPGYFPVGDTPALAALLHRAETDAVFYRELRSRCDRLRSLADPEREKETWRRLLAELERD